LLLWLASATLIYCWQTDWHAEMKFECDEGQHIYRWESKHDDGKRDRAWNFHCRTGYASHDCTWSEDANIPDKDMSYSCPTNSILTGAKSTHSGRHGDRTWRFKCCKLNTKSGTSCRETDYINQYWADYMDYRVPSGKAIIGIKSWHSNLYEDRVWKLRLCSYANCRANKMTILDNIKPRMTGTRVVGVATSQGCDPGVTHRLILGKTDTVTSKTGLATTKSEAFTYSTSIKVGATASIEFLGTGVSSTFSLTQNLGGSVSASTTESKETSTSSTSSALTTAIYKGPGAGLILASVDEYTIDQNSVNVRVDVDCDDGTFFSENKKMTFTSKTYSKTHFTTRLATFSADKCSSRTNECIRQIQGQDVAEDKDRVLDAFELCIKGRGTVAK